MITKKSQKYAKSSIEQRKSVFYKLSDLLKGLREKEKTFFYPQLKTRQKHSIFSYFWIFYRKFLRLFSPHKFLRKTIDWLGSNHFSLRNSLSFTGQKQWYNVFKVISITSLRTWKVLSGIKFNQQHIAMCYHTMHYTNTLNTTSELSHHLHSFRKTLLITNYFFKNDIKSLFKWLQILMLVSIKYDSWSLVGYHVNN